MKAYRIAFFILGRRRNTVARRIGFPYLLSAASAALLAVGGMSTTYKCFAPIVALLLQHVPATTAFGAIGIDLWGIICSIIGSFLLLFSLIYAHISTRRMLRSGRWHVSREQMSPSTDKRLLRLTLDLSMWLVLIGLVVLPQLLIGVGLVNSAISQMMIGESHIPVWVYVVGAAFAAAGMFIFELAALYRRIVGLNFYAK